MHAYAHHHLFGIDVTVVRYFTVYGPAGRPDMSIFRFIKWIDEGTPITIYGDGNQSRDFTYVTDIARGTCAAHETTRVRNHQPRRRQGTGQPVGNHRHA